MNAIRSLVGLGLGAGILLGGWAVWPRATQAPRLERQFVPGALGYEPGAAAPAPGRAAYRTRAMAMPGAVDTQRWQAANQVTGRFNFSHNLRTVFPPALFASHPEFFPVVGGVRLQPAAKAGDWNPDLGRVDVAQHAAAAGGGE